MVITVIGASGFLGQHLIRELLTKTDHTVRAFCRSADNLDFGDVAPGRLELLAGSALEPADVERALTGADAVYYLVHMMGSHGDFAAKEAEAARVVSSVGMRIGLPRLIFLGGLGDDNTKLSKHLASRHESGRILREQLPCVIEFRASMVIGEGSVGYDIVRTLAHKLPILMVPRWAVTRTQPITLHDTLEYLLAALDLPVTSSQLVQIGGPRALTYEDLVILYARKIGRRETVFAVPGVPHWAARTWMNFFMPPKHSGVAGPMVDSLSNEMVVEDDSALRLFPAIHPQPIELAFFDD